MRRNLPTIETAKASGYDPESGRFAQNIHSWGGYLYLVMRVSSNNWVRIYAHRVAWAVMTGAWPETEIDHINGKRDDNRWINLREVSRMQNCWNSAPGKNNKSGVKGVSWYKRDGTWEASIRTDGKRRFLGRFPLLEDAIAARRAAALHERGEFALREIQ